MRDRRAGDAQGTAALGEGHLRQPGRPGECVTVATGPLAGRRCLSLLDVAAEHYATRLKSLIKGVIDPDRPARAFTEFTTRRPRPRAG